MLAGQRVELVAGQDADIPGSFLRPRLGFGRRPDTQESRQGSYLRMKRKRYGILSQHSDYCSMLVLFLFLCLAVSRTSCDRQKTSIVCEWDYDLLDGCAEM